MVRVHTGSLLDLVFSCTQHFCYQAPTSSALGALKALDTSVALVSFWSHDANLASSHINLHVLPQLGTLSDLLQEHCFLFLVAQAHVQSHA